MGNGKLILVAMLSGVGLIVAPTCGQHPPRFIWNASPSVPIGLYRVEPIDRIDVADLVVVQPPGQLAQFLADRGYLPLGVPILKRVLAPSGTTVCRRAGDIVVHGRTYGQTRERDSHGRSLPAWQGCQIVANGYVFLMNWQAPDSFDSRYFGPLPVSSIIGRAVPIWLNDRSANATGAPARSSSTAPSRLKFPSNERTFP